MNAMELYQRHAHGLKTEGEKLLLSKQLPPDVREMCKANKPSIMAALKRDKEARDVGFLPLLSGEVYERQITFDMHVFIMLESGKWSAWRETFKGGKSSSMKQLATKVTMFELALMEAKKYVEYMTRERTPKTP